MSGTPKEQYVRVASELTRRRQSKSLEFTPTHPFDLENPKTW